MPLLPSCNNSEKVNNQTFQITWSNYDGVILEIDNVLEGTMPTYDGGTPTRPSDENYTYTWCGWNPKVVAATSDQTYVATFASTSINNKITINFDLGGGSSPSYTGSKKVDSFTKDVFFFDCVKEGWSFRGWSYNNVKIFDEKGNQLVNPTIAQNMTFVAVYSQTAKMEIVKNISEAGTVTGQGEYPYNTNVDVSATPNTGYVFVGWYFNNILLSTTPSYNYMMWSEDVTLEARFKLDVFTMKIYSNNVDYGLVLLQSSTNVDYLEQYEEEREYTSSVTIAAFSKTDVRFLGWYDENNNLVETNAVYSLLMPNHNYTLEAKWDYFTIGYELNGGTNNPLNPTSYTSSSSSLPLSDPSRDGYNFAGWKYEGNTVSYINPSWIKNVTLEATWSPKLNNLSLLSESSSKGSVEILSGSGYSDENITIGATPVGTYVFKGWYVESKRVSVDNPYTFKMPLDDYSLTAKFYTNNEAINLGIVPKYNSSDSTIQYGLYPQSIVTDSSLITSLEKLNETDVNGWYLYNEKYYISVIAHPGSKTKKFSNNQTIIDGNTYWFKCEPILWKIISNSDNEYTLLSSVLLDVQQFYKNTYNRTIDSNTIYPNNYAFSNVRAWLNSYNGSGYSVNNYSSKPKGFYNSAFALSNEHILTTNVYNGVDSVHNSDKDYVCDDTNDKVFLPSYQEYSNIDYLIKFCETTDFTRAKGSYVEDDNGRGKYWTRSPSYVSIGMSDGSYVNHPNEARIVGVDSNLSKSYVSDKNICMRPAITLRLPNN